MPSGLQETMGIFFGSFLAAFFPLRAVCNFPTKKTPAANIYVARLLEPNAQVDSTRKVEEVGSIFLVS